MTSKRRQPTPLDFMPHSEGEDLPTNAVHEAGTAFDQHERNGGSVLGGIAAFIVLLAILLAYGLTRHPISW